MLKLITVLAVALGSAFSAVAAVNSNYPTGTRGLFLVDKLGAHVRFLDPVTYKERSNIPLPTNPHDFAFTADRKIAYVPIYGDGVYNRNPNPGHEVAIIDMENEKLVGMIDIAPYRAPHGIQIDENGKVYVACDLDRKLLVLDPKTRKVVDVIDTEGTAHWIGILPDASKIYATNKNDRPFVSVIDLKTKQIVNRIENAGGTQGVAISPDGKRVVIMSNAEPVMLVVDPVTDAVVERISLKDQKTPAYKAYFSPDGRHLLTMNLVSTAINVFDTANLKGAQTVLTIGKDPMGIAFSADGKTALVANHGDGTVSVIDLARLQVIGNFKAGTGIETLTYY